MAEGKSPDYPMSMTAAWQLSVSALRRQIPQALELLRCCAFFGPEAIPRDVFRPSSLLAGTGISELIDDPILLSRAIRELGRFALIKLDGRSIVVHRLIQALLRDELGPEEQSRYRHEVHLILAASATKSPDDRDNWPRYRELVAHVAARYRSWPAASMVRSARSPRILSAISSFPTTFPCAGRSRNSSLRNGPRSPGRTIVTCLMSGASSVTRSVNWGSTGKPST